MKEELIKEMFRKWYIKGCLWGGEEVQAIFNGKTPKKPDVAVLEAEFQEDLNRISLI